MDVYAASLIGFNPEDILTFKRAYEHNLGEIEPGKLKLKNHLAFGNLFYLFKTELHPYIFHFTIISFLSPAWRDIFVSSFNNLKN